MSDLTGIGAVADLATGIIGKIWPDKTAQQQAELAAAVQLVQAQMDVNKTEAASPSVFVGGARPFVMWVCATGCAWNWVLLPVSKFACAAFGHPIEFSSADLAEMMPILMGMLGLGGLRTLEKIQGVARS